MSETTQIATNPAREWAAAIERGEMDPADVDLYALVHDDATTLIPELEQHLSAEQLARFETLQEQKIDDNAAANVREHGGLSEDEQAALEALADPESERVVDVDINEATLSVKNYTPERIENKIERAFNHRDELDVYRSVIPEVMAFLIESPPEYANEQLWRQYAREYGVPELTKRFLQVLEPKMDKAESDGVVDRFRQRQQRLNQA